MDTFLWVEQYRPKTVDDCILPQSLKDTFKEFVEHGNVPNVILSLLIRSSRVKSLSGLIIQSIS